MLLSKQPLQKSEAVDRSRCEQYRIEIDGQRLKQRKFAWMDLAKAEAQKAQGVAEAEIIRLKGLAEAEAKQKIAEAFEQFGQAAILDMIVEMLPEYAKEVAKPLSNIDKITIVDTGSGMVQKAVRIK